MIFVTVGTHEQPFDRLIRKVDELKEKFRKMSSFRLDSVHMNQNIVSGVS